MPAKEWHRVSYNDIALSVIARICGIPAETITPDMELVADLDMDSAKALELLVELEERFDVEIDDDDAAALNTVRDIFTFVDSLEP
jgi:acyl carrier protein